jgi:hypothetical protein
VTNMKRSDRQANEDKLQRGAGEAQSGQSGIPAVTAPSDAEKQEIAAATGRHKERSPRVAINIKQPKNGPIEFSPTHSDGAGWQTRLQDALGTSSHGFVDMELARLMSVFRDREGVIDERAVNTALAVIDGIKPQNEIEAMVAVQMAVTHGLAMKFIARLYSGIQSIREQDSTALTLSRLQRAFTTQMDALSNMRRGGRQKVTVEHVHVYPGGQAIVGNVSHTGRGAEDEKRRQAHATDDKRAIAFAPGTEMRCADQEREAVPVAGGEGEEALPDARRSPRLGSAEGGAQRKLSPRLLHRRGNRRAPGGEGPHS